MTHLPALIADLGLMLSIAAVTTLVFKKIDQPVVLGYILAGLLVGPHFDFLPTVYDEKNITTWSEIGVIFLLFSLGLEFSFKRVVHVGGTAGITALTTILFMLGAGALTGTLLGWSSMDSIFLGGILCISSTTIIVRALDELGLRTRGFANLVLGVLVIEDLVAILLLVLLSTVAVSQQFSGTELLLAMAKLGGFLIAVFVIGIYMIPTVLQRTRKLMNAETLLIVAIALCLGMVYLATRAGFSAALGAFIMGSLLAETVLAERIEHLVKPVKDLFGAIFFVSVGMMIDPLVLVEHWLPVVILSVVVMIGQPLSSTIGALIAGQPFKRSVQTGMSLSQIGEFSFIIATLGVTLGVTSPELYPIAVAVSAVTTFATPYMIRASSPVADTLHRMLPTRLSDAIDRYSRQAEQVQVTSDWRILLRAYLTNLSVFLVLCITIVIVAARLVRPLLDGGLFGIDGGLLTGMITILVLLPFIWAMSIRRIERAAYRHLWLSKRVLRGPLVVLEVVRVLAAIIILALVVNLFFAMEWAFTATLLFVVLAVVAFRSRLNSFYGRIENRFISNLYQREQQRKRTDLAPWDMHLAEVKVAQDSVAVGSSLMELQLREKHGVNIAMIERGDRTIPAPGRDDRLLPGDELLVIGTDAQLADLERSLNTRLAGGDGPTLDKEDMALEKYRILPRSPLIGQSIRDSGLREQATALVAGIERGDERLVNPEGMTVFEQGDLLWLVGSEDRIHRYMEDRKAARE